jgi:hypothetical protein
MMAILKDGKRSNLFSGIPSFCMYLNGALKSQRRSEIPMKFIDYIAVLSGTTKLATSFRNAAT